jgi:hypothetical protein
MHYLRCRLNLTLAGLLALAFIVPRPARAQQVYVEGSGHEFGSLDLSTGDFTYFGTTTPLLLGLGMSPNGTLYGLDDQSNAHLYRVDPTSGITTDLGAVGHAAIAGTVGSDGKIYAIDDSSGSTGLLYTIAPSTMNVTTIGDTGLASSGLLTFDNIGNLYTTQANPNLSDDLYSLNTTTGAATLMGSLGSDLSVSAGAFTNNSLDGFTLDQFAISIDTGAGSGTIQSPFSLPNQDLVMAAAPYATPEPGVWTLLFGLGLVAASLCCRQRGSERRQGNLKGKETSL